MKRYFVIAAVVFAFAATAFSQTQSDKDRKTEQELIRFMTEWGDASGRRDTATLDRILPDDLVLTQFNGRVESKTQYLEAVKNIPSNFTIKDSEQQVSIYGKTAIVRARYTLTIGEQVLNLRYTTTFLKRGGRWQPVALHSSPIIAQ